MYGRFYLIVNVNPGLGVIPVDRLVRHQAIPSERLWLFFRRITLAKEVRRFVYALRESCRSD